MRLSLLRFVKPQYYDSTKNLYKDMEREMTEKRGQGLIFTFFFTCFATMVYLNRKHVEEITVPVHKKN
ncbi:hypothetical protein CEXT_536571 [Caerostris extrusa]|uniref:Uncharacterized protein n=1 Tax=Caerostris extrusa TaxID=172846 RepID=A0AAV4TTW4_CAEEX|nr:hypothetical protein CEXT_536571 [Caerostris extrusa]